MGNIVCTLCDAGIPYTPDGIHVPTQRHGMIPPTPCRHALFRLRDEIRAVKRKNAYHRAALANIGGALRGAPTCIAPCLTYLRVGGVR